MVGLRQEPKGLPMLPSSGTGEQMQHLKNVPSNRPCLDPVCPTKAPRGAALGASIILVLHPQLWASKYCKVCACSRHEGLQGCSGRAGGLCGL